METIRDVLIRVRVEQERARLEAGGGASGSNYGAPGGGGSTAATASAAVAANTAAQASRVRELATASTQAAAAVRSLSSEQAALLRLSEAMASGSLPRGIAAMREAINLLPRETAQRQILQAQLTANIAGYERMAAAARMATSAGAAAVMASRQRGYNLEEYELSTRNPNLGGNSQENFRTVATAERIAAFRRQKEEQARDDARKTAAEQVAAANQAARGQEEAHMRAISSAKQVGESVMLIIRGYALLGANAPQDVQRLLNTLLQVQGTIDLFKGSVGVILQLTQTYRALAQASSAAAVAQTAANVAGGGGAGRAASGVAGAAGSVISGAAGAGISGAGAAGSGLLARLGLGGVALGTGIALGAGLDSLLPRSPFDPRVQEQARTRANREFADRSDLIDMQRGIQSRDFAASASRAAQRTNLFAQAGRGTPTDQINAFTQQRTDAQNELGRLARDEGGGGSRASVLSARQTAAEAVLAAERGIAEAIARQVDLRQKSLEGLRATVQSAKDSLQNEKERNQSIFQRAGSLNPGEISQLRRFNDRANAGGQFNEFELRRIEQLLGPSASGFVGGQRETRGRRLLGNGAGINALVDRAGLNLTGAGSQEANLSREIAALQQGSAERPGLDQLAKAIGDYRKRQVEQIDGVLRALNTVDDVVAAMEKLRAAEDATRKRVDRLEFSLRK